MTTKLMNDALVCQKVHTAWEIVFRVSNKILADEKRVGYFGMEIVPDPDIHQMMSSLKGMDSILEYITTEFTLPPDEFRMIINARTQITRMGSVAAALKSDDRDAFDLAMAELNNQAAF